MVQRAFQNLCAHSCPVLLRVPGPCQPISGTPMLLPRSLCSTYCYDLHGCIFLRPRVVLHQEAACFFNQRWRLAQQSWCQNTSHKLTRALTILWGNHPSTECSRTALFCTGHARSDVRILQTTCKLHQVPDCTHWEGWWCGRRILCVKKAVTRTWATPSQRGFLALNTKPESLTVTLNPASSSTLNIGTSKTTYTILGVLIISIVEYIPKPYSKY